MTDYATIEDLRRRIGGSVYDEVYSSNDSAAGTDHDTARADLSAAAAEIDGAVAFRYRLPVTGARSLALLKDWCLTLAEERTFARPAGSLYTEKVTVRVNQVRKYLDMVRAGDFRLPDAVENGSSQSDSPGGIALVKCDSPQFTRKSMEGF